MARRNLSARQPAKNLVAAPPTRKTMGPNGVMVTEKLCPIPFNEQMVALDGGITTVPLANGFTIRGFKGNDYGVHIRESKLKAGFLPVKECPVASGAIPGDDPCRGQFEGPCPHLRKVMEARAQAYREEKQNLYDSYRTNTDRMVAAMEKSLAKKLDTADDEGGRGRKGMPRG